MPKSSLDCFIGIDPGKSGGICFLYEGRSNNHIRAEPMPATERDTWLLFKNVTDNFQSCFAAIEKVHAMPGQGVTSMFTFGQNYGFLRACLIAADIPFIEVTPIRWMKALGLMTGKPNNKKRSKVSEWKNHLKNFAQNLHPKEKVTLKTADAILVAEYCWRERGRHGRDRR